MHDSDPAAVDLGPLAEIDQTIHTPARLMVVTYLYVVDRADFVFLMRVTGLTQGNLSRHITKLEEAGYVDVTKTFRGKRPCTMLKLTAKGRNAFREYKDSMRELLNDLPD